MTSTKQSTAAEKVRDTYRKERMERARQAPIDRPAVVVPQALAPIEGDLRNLWPRSLHGRSLTMEVPLMPGLQPEDILTFYINRNEIAQRVLVDPQTNPEELRYEVVGDYFTTEGEFELHYHHYQAFDGNAGYSFPWFLTVDHTPPNNNVAGLPPGLPQGIIDAGGLWKEYLDANTTVDITVPRSSDITAGDRVDVFWGNIDNPGAGLPVFGRVLSEASDVRPGLPVTISIPSTNLQNLPAGKYVVLYRYTDRTGNAGQLSQWTEVETDLSPAPGNLPVPQVPLHADSLIDREDGRAPVTVLIVAPGYTNQQPGDEIEVTWEGRAVPKVAAGPFPQEIPVPWPLLDTGNATKQRTFNISYTVVRGARRTKSQEIPINVDFSVAGVDPDPVDPDPVNPDLPLVVVKSRDPNPQDNVLTDADKGLPATAEVPNPVAQGQFLRLYWGNHTDYVDEVEITTQQPDDPIAFEIAWADIETGGYSDRLPVYYRTWNGVNEQHSPTTEVDVRITDRGGLADVIFPDRWSGGNPDNPPLINCCSLPWNGIRVQVPGDPVNFEVGDKVTLSWQAYSDRNGTVPIAGTAYTAHVVDIDADKVQNGFELTIPYTPYVELIVTAGSGIVTYVLAKADGQTGSRETLVNVSRLNGPSLCTPASPGTC